MTGRTHALHPFVLLTAGALLLAACSSDGDSSTPATSAAVDTTAVTSVTDTTAGETTAPITEPTTPPTTVPLEPGAVTFEPYVAGFTKPVDVTFRPGEPTLYVVQQDGRIVTVKDGKVADTVLDISAKVSTGGEQGLLGMAFHPTESLAYVNYTDASGNTVVAEFAVKDDGSFDAASERKVLGVEQPFPNHNGGKVTFGPDGFLYIALGDGGAGGDPNRHALDLGSMLGKILRIDPVAAGGKPYTVPDDNPFVGTSGAQPEIWAYGLRNPWRFDFDTETGDLWIADVGQNAWEEVDVALAADGGGKGVNFGWSAMEGNHRFNDDQDPAGAQAPIWEYPHGDEGCSVSGGAVYRGVNVPSLVGAYVVADYCSGKVWALQPSADAMSANVVPLGTVASPVAVVRSPEGELFVLAHGDGTIYRITPA
ncbi:MAG: PQQ-dependent sugar dehydrogenase [Ilumatobacteraceae bacterium]